MANLTLKENLDIQTGSASFIGALPALGHILPFAGPSNKIPTGWFICDGTNGTPDLRGKLVGYKSGASLLSTEVHTHTFTHTLPAFGASTVSHTSNISAALSGTNGTNHTHQNDDYMNMNGGYSGPANRSNGTQANVTSQYHAHPSSSTSASNTTAAAGAHNHGFDAYNHSLSGNAHSHSISSATTSSVLSDTDDLPSIFYVNFIMKAA
jgi:hypothetical protein